MKSLKYLAFILPIISYSQVGIGTEEPKTALDVNGQVTIRETLPIKGEKINRLYINRNGLVGIDPVNTDVTSRVFSATAETTNIVNTPALLYNFNNRIPQYIALENNFIKINTLGIISNGNNLLFNEDGTYLIDFSINFKLTIHNNGDAYLLGVLEIKSPGDENWEPILANRMIVNTNGYSKASRQLTFPSQIKEIKKNTEMRVVFYRTHYLAGTIETPQGDDLTYLEVASEKDLKLDGLNLVIHKL